MADNVMSNKRIAKNTLLLYVRTFFVMLISIYTSRVVLQALGVDDYGIYQVVGGMVAMFAMLSNALSAAISRFVTFEIGSGNKERLERVFSTSRVVLLVLAGLVFILTEIIGMWFVNTQMNIPDGRMHAAVWVMHCSVITFCINLIAIPYSSCVIAHEHMNIFAYMSILEALLKLGICYLIIISTLDKLIIYAILMTIIAAIIRIVYSMYCHRHFKESKAPLVFYKPVFKEMFGFAGWSFFTSATSVLKSQGINMLINVYYGVAFNAARGLANQVNNAMVQFVSSFVSAINPQITKSYAAGETEALFSLVCRGARFSFYLTLVMFVPLFFEADMILNIWLTVVPEKTVLFVRLALIMILLDGAGYTLYTANLATGRIKKYSIILSLVSVSVFPMTWIFYSKGFPVETAYYLAIMANVCYHIARIFITQGNVGLRVSTFLKQVYLPILITTILAVIPSIVVVTLMPMSYLRLIVSLVVGVFMTILTSFFVGITRKERELLKEKTISYIKARVKI